jgi:hypothetical protein
MSDEIPQELRDQYKEVTGRYPRKGMTAETVQAKIDESKVENVELIDEPQELEVTKIEDLKGPAKPLPAAPVEHVKPEGQPLKKGREYLVFYKGTPRYMTEMTIRVGLKTHANNFSFPEGTPFQVPANTSKCKNC